MNIILVQRMFTYHENLTGNHASQASKIANHSSHQVLFRVTRKFGLNHAANFGAITRHAKKICHITIIHLFRSAIESALAYLCNF